HSRQQQRGHEGEGAIRRGENYINQNRHGSSK
ncbi:MAG: hypothetical protein ACI8S3_001261, partial [Alphaproteobacteria bacterium]